MTAKRSHPSVTLAVLSIAGLSYSVLASSIVPAIPTIRDDLGASETGVTFLLTGFLLSASVGTALLGRLGDMFGKEHVLLWTLVIFAAGTLLGGLADSLPVLVVARVIQGVGGGIFPLSFGIIRDEFPREKVAGSIGMVSAILGIGGGVGIVVGALIVEHLGWHWLFWMPLAVTVVAAVCTWRFIPESPVRVPGRINWLAAALMSAGISVVLIAISKAPAWGWSSARTLGLLVGGLALCVSWVAVESRSKEPLIDMAMMRRRGVWTANLVAFLLGAGMYSMFFIFPQFAQEPKSTGYGFGASIVESGLYLLPSTVGVFLLSSTAGLVARRWGSRAAVIAGSAITTASYVLIAAQHDAPIDMLGSAALLGIGIGLAFAALGNLVVEAVPPEQTGAAGGMNTVMRTIGGALGGQLAATLIASHTLPSGEPAASGYTDSFVLAAGFLVVCTFAALLVPRRRPFAAARLEADAAQA